MHTQYVLNPTLTKQQVSNLDTNLKASYDLNNKKYLPGTHLYVACENMTKALW